jgi:UDPglucose 6-dehydrogenase
MKVTVIGTGYVGLVSGTCLADAGHDVLCIDSDKKKIEELSKGQVPIYEPGLETLLKSNIEAQRLTFSTDVTQGVRSADIIFIAVGTPPSEDGSADLSHVLEVARSIGKAMDSPKVVATKSTVPVGTGDLIRNTIQSELDAKHSRNHFMVVSNPEFLAEGAAVTDFQKPDRIIVGTDSPEAGVLMEELYAPFNRNNRRLLRMDIRSAELTKYAANAMLATKISFMNEIANLSEQLGADVEAVRLGIGSDPRIGSHFLYPGCGYGGSCFPKDVRALSQTAQDVGYDCRLLGTVQEINEKQKLVIGNKILQRFNKDIENLKFAVWGLSFKPNTDDMREAPSVVIINQLLTQGAIVCAFDPVAMPEAESVFRGRQRFSTGASPYDVLVDADALVVVTEWNQFRGADFEKMGEVMRKKIIFDGRNLFDPNLASEHGFEYRGIGRGLIDH